MNVAQRETALQRAHQRTAHEPLGIGRQEPAQGGAHAGLELVGRFSGDVVDRSAGGVAAVERALRALEDLHALEIEDGPLRHHRERQVLLVDVDADRGARRLAGLVEADSSQRIDRHRIAALRIAKARNDLAEVTGVGDAEVLELVAGEGAYRDRHVVDVLGALLRRDDDLFECRMRRRRGGLAFRGLLLRVGQIGADERRQSRDQRHTRSSDHQSAPSDGGS